MLFSNKLTSRIVWIILASLIGIEIGYLATRGGEIALGAFYDKTQELILGKRDTTLQNIPAPGVVDVVASLEPPEPPQENNNVSIGFVGDIIPVINTPTNIFSDVISYTEKPDIMIGNFEGVATSNIYSKCKFDSLNCFAFNGDNSFLKILSDSSFDVLNVANNHFNDYGQIGQDVTIDEILKMGMIADGVKNEITYLTKNELKIGIVGFSNYQWTTDMNDTENLKTLINEADQNSDIVVVIFHGGGEGIKYAHTPSETEWYLGENRGNLRSFAHSVIDAGADIVFGSGPHVLRGIEWYNDKLIAYSLGNFASLDALSTSGSLKTSAMIEITLGKEGAFLSGTIFPFEIDGYGIPHPDLNNTAISTINDLSKEDFGEQGITLSPSGEIIFR